MDIRTQISSLSEDDFRVKVIIPILWALGAYKVLDNCGPMEDGKDVYFAYEDFFGFGREYKHCCFLVKVGDIKKSGKNNIRMIEGQIKEALSATFPSPIDQTTHIRVEEFYLATNGIVNQEARRYLSKFILNCNTPNFKIFDVDKITSFIKKLRAEYTYITGENYLFGVNTFQEICNQISNYKEKKQVPPGSLATKITEGQVIEDE